MEIKTVIVDDELNAIKMLQALLEKYCPNVIVLDTFQDPLQAYAYLKSHETDLLFLDVEMPGMTGFDLLKKIGKPPFEVIFTTAYDQYALDAFKADALDYVMKPVDEEELMKSVKKVETKKEISQRQIDEIVHRINDYSDKSEFKVALPFFEGLEFIALQDIIYCLAENNYTQIVLKDGTKRMISKTLKDIEKLIPNDFFFRVHNSYLINLKYIHKYYRTDGGYLIMTNGDRVKISRSKKEILLNKL